ncbi:KaiC-like protein ATPase [Halapricum desulfuricans]|uniref:KaiC-like protein ATPase n=1 Tax=Halapricum desulfuricans TaxID=2841257 RepID=A0A897N2J1_9EURY|nr:KaiC-like protein ATPase [Halapricum desulfuricans]
MQTPSNVLVDASNVDDTGMLACTRLLLEADLDRIGVVTVEHTPAEWDRQLRQLPRRVPPVEYVDVETLARSTSASTAGDRPSSVTTVADPEDLTALGTAMDDLLQGNDERVGVCLHSISALLQFVEREPLFKFLHLMSERARRAEALGAYYLDSTTSGAELRALFSNLCEVVATFDGEAFDLSSGKYASASASAD